MSDLTTKLRHAFEDEMSYKDVADGLTEALVARAMIHFNIESEEQKAEIVNLEAEVKSLDEDVISLMHDLGKAQNTKRSDVIKETLERVRKELIDDLHNKSYSKRYSKKIFDMDVRDEELVLAGVEVKILEALDQLEQQLTEPTRED